MVKLYIGINVITFISKYFIFIDNMKTKSEVLAKLVNKSGVKKTLDITGYSMLELFMALEEKVEIDYEMAYVLIFELKSNTNLLHDKIGRAKLNFSDYENLIYWSLNFPNESMEAICTPFWGGDPLIPIDTIEYSYNDENNISHSIYRTFTNVIKLNKLKSFNSIKELVYWYNTSYLNEVYEVLLDYLEEYRREYKYTD